VKTYIFVDSRCLRDWLGNSIKKADSRYPIMNIILQHNVNAVVFADESCHLIYSGSDDNTCEVPVFLMIFENVLDTLLKSLCLIFSYKSSCITMAGLMLDMT